MSHHFDTPTAIEDGRLNLCDLYAFPGEPGMTTLVLTVNPDAGHSSPTTFRPDAVYEFVLQASKPNRLIGLRVRFDDIDEHGAQAIRVLHARAGVHDLNDVSSGTVIGAGSSEQQVDLDFGDGRTGRAWAGMAADPFWGNGVALIGLLTAAAAGEYRPEVFDTPGDIFEGRDVTAIALEIPDSTLPGDRLAVWARITLHGHAPQRQASRIGQPLFHPVFFPAPGSETETLNAGTPDGDRTAYTDRVRATATTLARLANLPDPTAHAEAVSAAFLPDVLTYAPGSPAAFRPGAGNGRALTDDAFGAVIESLLGAPLAATPSPQTFRSAFPYLPIPHKLDVPALVELFGLRGGGAAPGPAIDAQQQIAGT